MKRILFYLFRPLLTFKKYRNPDDVGGWLGWYELAGKAVAFEAVDGKRFFAF